MRQRALYKGHVVHWQEPTLAKASRLFYCVQWPVLVCRVNPSERQVNSTKIQLIGGPPGVVAVDGRAGPIKAHQQQAGRVNAWTAVAMH